MAGRGRAPTYWGLVRVPAAEQRERNFTDLVSLPTAMLEPLSGRMQSGEPLYLRFFPNAFGDLSKSVTAGVGHFDAPPDTFYLPVWMMEVLGVKEGARIRFEVVEGTALPRADTVQLKANDPAFLELPNPRAVLENALSASYRTLTEIKSGDAEVYVASVDETRRPSRTNFTFTCREYQPGLARVVVPTPIKHSSTFYIGIYAYGSAAAAGQVASQPSEAQGVPATDSQIPDPLGERTACPNCGEQVPSSRLTMHTAYCVRHNKKCTICNRVVRKTCTCGARLDILALQEHRRQVCPIFPNLDVLSTRMPAFACKTLSSSQSRYYVLRIRPAPNGPSYAASVICITKPGLLRATTTIAWPGSLRTRLSECGARTEVCEVCGQRVQLKQFPVHRLLHPASTTTTDQPRSSVGTVAQSAPVDAAELARRYAAAGYEFYGAGSSTPASVPAPRPKPTTIAEPAPPVSMECANAQCNNTRLSSGLLCALCQQTLCARLEMEALPQDDAKALLGLLVRYYFSQAREQALHTLQELGFDRAQSEAALRKRAGDLHRAIETLLTAA
ncbi:uncharacterized protein MONBRDRAFT_5807 [Monosiga brevicollis MX1]|uniref:UBA domain-containing protein n=1 Tax=Monosiga brevicollis TaxID=81824 RepID=A9USI7_MONBE|nr:uncharacterized protein MONBRDRAFT_5807 [Monosiga brevicollis MX1]EDQ92108.1 predicted protein [Monosiga brevicollis MX1]|eukprot:XP_001743394.1 hypothetical protein [Monosiga brevicollis MX1]